MIRTSRRGEGVGREDYQESCKTAATAVRRSAKCVRVAAGADFDGNADRDEEGRTWRLIVDHTGFAVGRGASV